MRFKYTRPKQQPATPNPTLTSKIYRPMKFLPPTAPDTAVTRYSGFARLENYLDNTKQTIADNLSIICHKFHHNLTKQERESLHKLQRASQELTIKPADKNLGIVVMDTGHQWLHRTVSRTSDRQQHLWYSQEHVQEQLTHVLSNFKSQLTAPDKRLFKYLYELPRNLRTPHFYGIPKYISHIHVFFLFIP